MRGSSGTPGDAAGDRIRSRAASSSAGATRGKNSASPEVAEAEASGNPGRGDPAPDPATGNSVLGACGRAAQHWPQLERKQRHQRCHGSGSPGGQKKQGTAPAAPQRAQLEPWGAMAELAEADHGGGASGAGPRTTCWPAHSSPEQTHAGAQAPGVGRPAASHTGARRGALHSSAPVEAQNAAATGGREGGSEEDWTSAGWASGETES